MKNLAEVCKLSDTLSPEQQKCVAPNVYSIAQAHFSPDIAWFKAIYLDENPIGFIMVDTEEEEIPEEEKPCIVLWRFMIAKDFQGKGYGKKALDLVADKFRKEEKKYFYTSCVMAEISPYQFYLKYGFEDTGIMEEKEEILKMKL
jgi:diamine N-acetyltransferase